MDLLKENHIKHYLNLCLLLSLSIIVTSCTNEKNCIARVLFFPPPDGSLCYLIELYDDRNVVTYQDVSHAFDLDDPSNLYYGKKKSQKLSKNEMQEIQQILSQITADGDKGAPVTDWWIIEVNYNEFKAEFSYGLSSIPEYDDLVTFLIENSPIPIVNVQGNKLAKYSE